MPLVIASFALLPQAQAVTPAPDGGYAHFTTAEGDHALFSLANGVANTAVGWFSLQATTDGSYNTGVGAGALVVNTGSENTATGTAALLLNTTGASNTANGAFALIFNNSGNENTAMGDRALQNNTGSGNTAIGASALTSNTTGGQNTAVGYLAGANVTTGSGNVYIGEGVEGVFGESAHTYILNINTTTVSGGNTDTVTVDLSTGLLGHLSSSRRYKEEIKPMDKASETLFALKPVSYRFKKEIDQSQSLDYGLIAEEVAEVDPNLTIRDGKGQIEGVRYNAINAMLLNEFLKEHRKNEERDATIAQQQKQIDALTAGLQKVSTQLGLSKSAPRTVLNKQ